MHYKMRCDVCGIVFRSTEMQKRWDGLWVCWKDMEHRHPQDLLRVRTDSQSVRVRRPPPEPVFRDNSIYVTVNDGADVWCFGTDPICFGTDNVS